MSGCRSCPARVRWVLTETGARMPLNWDPDPAGNVVRVTTDDGPRARVLGPAELAKLPAGRRFMPHWATCPGAANHRKAKP